MRLKLKAAVPTPEPSTLSTILKYLVPVLLGVAFNQGWKHLTEKKRREVVGHADLFLNLLKQDVPIYLEILDSADGGYTCPMLDTEIEAGTMTYFGCEVIRWTPGTEIRGLGIIVTNDSKFFPGKGLLRSMRNLAYGEAKYGPIALDEAKIWPTNWLTAVLQASSDGANVPETRNRIVTEYETNREINLKTKPV